MKSEGRLLHENWDLHDTANVVHRPKHLTPEELQAGYASCYRRLFSRRSIWKRRPRDLRAIPSHLVMSYPYKRSNWFWHLLIRQRWTEAVWRPLVNLTRLCHLRFRRRLAKRVTAGEPGSVLSPGV
jgi:hypothetical protein